MRTLRQLFVWAVAISLLSACPQLPTSGSLPALDGSHLSGVEADHVGAATKAQIESGIAAVAAATDADTPSTLVKRDATGSFAGTLVGKSSFAVGKTGTQISDAGTLAIPADGSYFDLVGSGTTVNGMSAVNDGATIRLRVRDGVTFHHNSTSFALLGSLDFRAQAGDFLEFVSTGGGNWAEVSRRLATPTRMQALGIPTGDAVVAGTPLPLAYGATTINDALHEFTPATGTFTALQGGTYEFSAGVTLASPNWSTEDFCMIRANGASIAIASRNVARVPLAPSTTECISHLAGTFRAAPGATVVFSVQSSHNCTLDGNAQFSYLQVFRVAD